MVTPAGLRRQPDGRYTLGLRPHHISPVRNGHDGAAIEGSVQIAEISGSESVIHFTHGPLSWVSRSSGVHRIEVGGTTRFYVELDRCLYFAGDGTRIS